MNNATPLEAWLGAWLPARGAARVQSCIRALRAPWAGMAILYAAWLALFLCMFAESWVSEDAYITFRVIDNFLHGYGLRWNIDERVQVYTHPLWLLLHLPFAFLWDNLFHLNIALSLVCSGMAVGIVLLTFRKSPGITLSCFMLPLFLSKSFIDYSSSGLETSLSFLLFSLFGYMLVRGQTHRLFPLAIALLASLLLLNRLDHILMIAPVLAVLAWRHALKPCRVSTGLMIFAGALPLLCWFGFSFFYYGFFFPNTKYAKLDTGFPLSEYIAQGLEYSFIWLTQDTASVVTVAALLLLAFINRRRIPATTKALAIGILINIAYVITIGGDYMMGRFFAFIFFVAAWLLLATIPPRARPDLLFVAALCLSLAWAGSYFVRDIRLSCQECVPMVGRVRDARWTFRNNALFSSYWPLKMRVEGEYKFARDGKKLAQENPPPVKPLRYVGMVGYYAGPGAVIIDQLGLGDPLLSRLPAMTDRPFYVGHYRRRVPKGYITAMQTGDLGAMDPHLARYYERLRFITRGDLWNKDRLITTLQFNLGKFDAERDAFLQPPR
ncbi:MAG: hypothetical protein SFX19_05855 [Alphaproteobacteria bacterium]|nr:hypothetical protein [Alphaproteobacteria bacterium]